MRGEGSRQEGDGSYTTIPRRHITVIDAQGRAVAFGSASHASGDEPKYMTGPRPATRRAVKYTASRLARRDGGANSHPARVTDRSDLPGGRAQRSASLGTALDAREGEVVRRLRRRCLNSDGDRAGFAARNRIGRAGRGLRGKSGAPRGGRPTRSCARGGEGVNRRRAKHSKHKGVLDQALLIGTREPGGEARPSRRCCLCRQSAPHHKRDYWTWR